MNQGYPRLLGDIGGTMHAGGGGNKRSPVTAVSVQPCADHPDIAASARHYLQAQGLARPAMGRAGCCHRGYRRHRRMTNNGGCFPLMHRNPALGLERCRVVNDFTALALSLPGLQAQDLRSVGAGTAVAGACNRLAWACYRVGRLRAGTCPGMVGTRRWRGGRACDPAATDDEEAALLSLLRQDFPHVSAERALLSGSGLVLLLYQAVCRMQGVAALALHTRAGQ